MASQPVALFESKYTPELAASIVQRIGRGENLRAIARDVNIDWSTFYRWLKADAQLQADFDEARIQGAHAIAHDALALLEQQPERVDKRIDPGFVQWQRLKLEGTLKILAKWFPQHYGDKLLHAGHDGGAIKSETALSVKELAQQLRARASGVVIDNEPGEAHFFPDAGNQRLTDASERFSAVPVSNERDSDGTVPAIPTGRAQERGVESGVRRDGTASNQPNDQGRLGSADSEAAAPVRPFHGLAGQAAVNDQGAGLRAGAAALGAVSAGEAGGKRRSRGAGGRGGALKRGASAETGGTPAPRISESSQSLEATGHLQTAPSSKQRTRPSKNFAQENSKQKQTTSHFPPDEDWSPDDYV